MERGRCKFEFVPCEVDKSLENCRCEVCEVHVQNMHVSLLVAQVCEWTYIYSFHFFFSWKFVNLVWFCFIGHINQQNKSGGVHEPEGSLRAKPWSIFLFNQPPNEGLNYILQQWYLNLSKECIMFKKLCWIWNHFATSCFCSISLPSTAPTPNKDS